MVPHQRHRGFQLFQVDQARTHAVVDVVRVVGHLVSQIAQLRFKAGLPAAEEACRHAIGLDSFEQLRIAP